MQFVTDELEDFSIGTSVVIHPLALEFHLEGGVGLRREGGLGKVGLVRV